MLRRVAKSAFTLLSRTPKQLLFNTYRPTYCFAVQNQPIVSLETTIQEQIQHEEKNMGDLSQFTNFFQNQGWNINYDGIQVELSKKNGPYNLRILFNAKTPMSFERQQQEQEAEQQNQDFAEVSAFINKDGNPKWLALDFMVSETNQAHLATAAFINDYEFEKSQRKKGRAPAINYTGPELSSLQERFQEQIYAFIDALGISGEILQRAAEFSQAYEQQFYVQWLKDLKSLV